MSSVWKTRAALLLIALITFAIYLRTLSFDFVAYDDPVYVTENEHVRAGLTSSGIAYAFTTGETGTWQPLTLLSHMLDCTLFGQNAGGHHAINAVLHALNTFLLGLVLLRITGAAGPSLFVAAVFGLHPLHVESVAWISERKDVLSTFFFMATLYIYAIWAGMLRKRWLFFSTATFALGLLAKPMLVTLPIVLLLLDYWPLNRYRHDRKLYCVALLVAEKLPMFALSLAVSIATIIVQKGASATSSLEALPLVLRVENAAVAYVRYLGKIFWPAELLMYYPHPRATLTAIEVGAASACLLIITVLAIALRRRFPYLVVGWGWYVVTLVPVIGIVQVGTQAIADRYTYVPMVGVLIVVAWGARDLAATIHGSIARYALPAFSAIAIVVLTGLTWPQIGAWRNSESLYRHTLDASPDNPMANMGLGLLLVHQNKFADAMPYLEVAVAQRHREAEAHYNLGIALQGLKMLPQAAEHYRAAVKHDPHYSEAWNNLGVTLDALGASNEALGAFEQAVATGPHNERAAFNLLQYLVRVGKKEEARQFAQTAARIFPDSTDLKTVIATIEANVSNAPSQ